MDKDSPYYMSSDDEDTKPPPTCTCPTALTHVFDLKLDQSVVLSPETLRQVVQGALETEAASKAPKWITFPCGRPNGVILVITEDSAPGANPCPVHHFKLKVRNLVRDRKSEVFSEEFFCFSGRTKQAEIPAAQYQLKRKRFRDEMVNPHDTPDALIAKASELSGLSVPTTRTNPMYMPTMTRPPNISSKQHSRIAMLCETVRTTKSDLELARVTIMSVETSEVLYDEYVQPANPVVDHITEHSGITAQVLERVTKTLRDVQCEILQRFLFADTTVVGHNIGADFQALHVIHSKVVDLAVHYRRAAPHANEPISLKMLTATVLHRAIQNDPGRGHDPIEDLGAIVDLYNKKVQRGLDYGMNLKVISGAHDHDSNDFLVHLRSNGVQLQKFVEEKSVVSSGQFFNSVQHTTVNMWTQQCPPKSSVKYFTWAHLLSIEDRLTVEEVAANAHKRNYDPSKGAPPLVMVVSMAGESPSVYFA